MGRVGGSPGGWSGPVRPVNALQALTYWLLSVPVHGQIGQRVRRWSILWYFSGAVSSHATIRTEGRVKGQSINLRTYLV